jgi:hypothetical protein
VRREARRPGERDDRDDVHAGGPLRMRARVMPPLALKWSAQSGRLRSFCAFIQSYGPVETMSIAAVPSAPGATP